MQFSDFGTQIQVFFLQICDVQSAIVNRLNVTGQQSFIENGIQSLQVSTAQMAINGFR